MSTNCLVKSLKASVNDNELLKRGEIKIGVGLPYVGASYGSLSLYFVDNSKKIPVTALEGKFKTSVGGTELTSALLQPVGGTSYATIYFTGNVTLSILNKANINGFDGSYTTNKIYGKKGFVDIMNSLPNVYMYDNFYCTLFGDVKDIKSNLTSLATSFIKDGETQKLNDLLTACPTLTRLNCTGLSGNLSDLEGNTTLNTFIIRDNNIEGDVALIECAKFNNVISNYQNFSWSSRSSSKNIILGDIYLAKPDDRKRMLVDNSNCVRSDTSTLGTIKTLSVDTTDPEIAAALTALRAKNVEVKRENNTVIN